MIVTILVLCITTELESNKITLKAFKLYEKACDTYDSWCYNLADMYFNGYGTKQNYHKAIKLYSKTCDNGYAPSCNNLGLLYYNGNGVAVNYDKAL